MKNSFFIVIVGPTGVGKSDFATKLAKRISGEIVNADMGQLYTPVSIGTAKPMWQNESVPHHLFDLLNVPENFTVRQYHAQVARLLPMIIARDKIPILVGGSGFYVKSLFFPPLSESSEISTFPRDNAKIGSWDQLYAIDPERAAEIHPHDIYRISRALQLWEQTGQKPSSCAPVFNPLANALILHITRDRDDLYKRINDRTAIMLSAGWIDEVVCLSPLWHEFLRRKKLIGYKEIIDFIQNDSHSPEGFPLLIAQIQQSTRHYAKRQITFWRSFNAQIERHAPGISIEINLTLSTIDLYLEQLVNRIKE